MLGPICVDHLLRVAQTQIVLSDPAVQYGCIEQRHLACAPIRDLGQQLQDATQAGEGFLVTLSVHQHVDRGGPGPLSRSRVSPARTARRRAGTSSCFGLSSCSPSSSTSPPSSFSSSSSPNSL